MIASATLLRHLVRVNPPDASTVSAVRDRLNTDQPVMLALIAIVGLDRASQTAMIREAAARTNLLVDLMDNAYLAAGPEKSIRLFSRRCVAAARDGRRAASCRIRSPI